MSTGIGYYFGLPKAGSWWAFARRIPWWGLLHTILGTGLIASGTAALNQWYERDADCRMRRTSDRPIPSGRIAAGRALAFGIAFRSPVSPISGWASICWPLCWGCSPCSAIFSCIRL